MASNQLSDTGQTNPYATQTSIPSAPVAPDTSYRAFKPMSGQESPFVYWLNSKLPSNRMAYESWKTRKENEYNQQLADWQTYITSPEFQKQAYTAAGYNANYADPSAISAGSPGTYTTPGSAGAPGEDLPSMISQGIQTAMQIASGIQSLQMGSQELQGKKIENSFLGQILGKKSNLLSYQTQAAQVGLQKTLAELFGAENVPQVVNWLNGITGDIDLKLHPGGAEEMMSTFLVNGPYAKMLGANLSNIEARTKKLSTDEQLAELKKTWQGNENDWQEFEKQFRAGTGFLNILMAFLRLAL